MRADALSRARLRDVVAFAAAAAYVVLFLQVERGHKVPLGIVLFFAPLALLPVVLFRRAPLTRTQGVALGVLTILPLAAAWAVVIDLTWLVAAAIPLMVIATMVCARWPTATVALLLACATAYGSLKEYAGWSGQKSMDVILGGLWLAAVWRWVVFPRARPTRAVIWPGVALLIGYVLFSAGEILTAETTNQGLQSFRQSTWYLAIALLVAYAPWTEQSRERVKKVALLAILAVGAYATLRWATGPTGKERAIAARIQNNFLDGKLRPIGSFFTVKELAAWSAMAVPFTAGMALILRGRWRLVAILGCLAATTAMFSADVRAAPAAAVPGVLAVLILYATAQSFRGQRGPTVAIAIVATFAVGAGAFALTLGSDQDSGRRYRAILDPGSDAPYQARLIKWRTAWDDIGHAPLGHGLGSSGIVQVRFGKVRTIGSIDIDNSYLKVAYEQGFVVMVLYAAMLVLLLGGLARRALVSSDRDRAGPAIAACGTLVAMMVLFFVGDYVEGLVVATGWLIVGIGLSQFTSERREPPAQEPDPLPGNAW